MRTGIKSALALAVVGILGVSATQAATIAYVGKELSTVGGNTATAVANFRSTDVAKAFDVDANNVYGSDGYKFFGTANNGQESTGNTKGTLTSLPSYISAVTPVGNYGTSGANVWNVGQGAFGKIDDPSLSTGAGVANIDSGVFFKRFDKTVTPYLQDMLDITVASSGTFRIGIAQISGDQQKGQAIAINGVSVNTLPAPFGVDGTAVDNYDRFDIYLFDVTATAGDHLLVQGKNVIKTGPDLGGGQVGVAGLTFDSVPEPASFSLLGLGALGVLARRRR